MVNPRSRMDAQIRWLSRGCAASSVAVALLAGVSWMSGEWSRLAFGADYVPMAPSTAIALTLLGVAALATEWRPDGRPSRAVAASAASAVFVIATVVLILTAIGVEPPFEAWLSNTDQVRQGIPVGRMSPFTAATLCVIAGALLCRLRALQRTSIALALVGFAIGSVTVGGYATATPFFYGGSTVPIALLTAICLTLVALALLFERSTIQRLMRPAGGDVHSLAAGQPPRADWPIVMVLLVLGGAVALVGLLQLRRQQHSARLRAQEELSAIADVKIERIAQWRDERFRDATFLATAPPAAEDVEAVLRDPSSAAARARTLGWMEAARASFPYLAVGLCDPAGRTILSIPETFAASEPTRAAIHQARDRDEVLLSDFYPSGSGGGVRLDVVAPVRPLRGAQSRGAAGDRAMAALVLQMDPAAILFPLIQSWPTASETAECLLVRRDGGEVLFLNELRHQPGAAFTLRRSASDLRLLAALAASGESGVAEGSDYRGVPVVAAFRPVPDTPWFMVAKVDQTEIYARLSRQALVAGSILGALLLIALLSVGTIQRQRAIALMRYRITERARAEDEIRRVNASLADRVTERTAALEAANRELEAFTYSVSHDLRAPLRAIEGFSRILEDEQQARLDEEGRRLLGVVRSNVARMGQLVDDLLAFSRVGRQPLRRARIDMSAVVAAVIDELGPNAARAGLTLTIGPLCPAPGDPALLRQVWHNLLSNAVKFTSATPAAVVELGCSRAAGGCEYWIRDNGAGFDMRYAGKLFKVFERLHGPAEFEGTGVGLAIVDRIVSRHGGRVSGEGRPGEGATFRFWLPDQPRMTRPASFPNGASPPIEEPEGPPA